MSKDVYIATRKAALRKLWMRAGFKKLPKDVREQLIEQQAYVIRLNYDLDIDSTTINNTLKEQLEKYSSDLEKNIINAINNYKTLGDNGEEEFSKIKNKIESKVHTKLILTELKFQTLIEN